jgi:hypothetical protein
MFAQTLKIPLRGEKMMADKQKLSDDMLDGVSGGFSDNTKAAAKDVVTFLAKLVIFKHTDHWSSSKQQKGQDEEAKLTQL